MVQFEVWHLVVGAVLTSKPTISTDSEAVCSDLTESLIMTSSVHLIFKFYPLKNNPTE